MAQFQTSTQFDPERDTGRNQALPAYDVGASNRDEAAANAVLYDRILTAAQVHATAYGCSIEQLLINTGALSEEELYQHIALRLGIPFIPFPVLLDQSIAPHDAMAAGLAPIRLPKHLHPADQPAFIYAPQGSRLDWLITHGAHHLKSSGARIGITTPSAFQASIRASIGRRIARDATERLPKSRAQSTAASLPTEFWILILVVFSGLLVMSAIVTPLIWSCLLAIMSCFPIIPGVILKMTALKAAKKVPLQIPILAHGDLPVYSVLVPIYREAGILDQLIGALISLDYPHEKLDIKLLLETDDVETLTALEAYALPPYFDIVVCPRGQPRTKPRALSIGLAYATGDLIVVYDAEDIPERDQLKKAASRFAHADSKLACLQARLTIDNLNDSWLTHQFALEYAGLFDVMLDGLAQLHKPIPLGGTSNHFRRAALESVGGWDPWNVTEDADLGLRLYRSGYRVETLRSTTHEEAPVTMKAWLNQRTRWLKGWMQTSAIHLRSHGPDSDRMNWNQRYALALTASFSPICILFHPLLVFASTFALNRNDNEHSFSVTSVLFTVIFISTFLLSLIFDMMIAIRGARARGIKTKAAHLFGLIPYSILKTIAAWRAVFELIHAPYHWRKTSHGQAKSSRLTDEHVAKTVS